MGNISPTLASMEKRLSILERTNRLFLEILQQQAASMGELCSTEKIERRDEAVPVSVNGQNSVKNDSEHVIPPEEYYVERLVCGHKTGCFLPAEKALKLLEDRSFDIRIDDIQLMIKVKGRAWRSVYGIPPFMRGMVYLIVTSVPAPLRFSHVANLFGYGNNQGKSRDDRIRQYPNCLRKTVLSKRLVKTIFGRCKNKAYDLGTPHWSFLWVRRSESVQDSALLYELPGKPFENQ